MNHRVLARKWRPGQFSDIHGQPHLVRILTHALERQRLHHAYLFTGTRGIGKTTVARLFAKCLNCEKGLTATPCDSCDPCQAINENRFIDLIEIDAASRTKVEDTRELLENVQYMPAEGRYKVYILDEVHMFSTNSFNALLKTLEEPPEHVIFLLATTDPQKLPATVLSRCLQLHLKPISIESIVGNIEYILNKEHILYEKNALLSLANAAHGSMRDALSLVDQAIAFSGDIISESMVNTMLGSVSQTPLCQLLEALAKHDVTQVMMHIDTLIADGFDIEQALDALLSLLHRIAMIQHLAKTEKNETTSAPEFALSTTLSQEEVQLLYQIALIGKRDLALAPTPRSGLEMIMLRMLAFKPKEAISITSEKQIEISLPNTWSQLIPQLNLSGMVLALAMHCEAKHIDAARVDLLLSPNHQPMLQTKTKESLNIALNKHFNKQILLTINISLDTLHSPTAVKENKMAAEKEIAMASMSHDKHLQKIMQAFDITLEDTLVSSREK